MANATDVWITALQGTDPQNLMPYITRQKIYEARFWKEECFGLTVTNVLQKAANVLQCVGGTFGPNMQPTKFICLVLKLLQLQPDADVMDGFVQQEDFKYVRALGLFYLRLTARPVQIYQQFEPLYRDYRKLRIRLPTSWQILHMDQFVHQLLVQETSCGLTIPRLPLRHVLYQGGYLDEPVRRSALQDVLLEFQQKHQYGSDNKEEEDDDHEDTTLDHGALLAYLQHKAEEQNSTAAQVLWQSRLQKKLLQDQKQQQQRNDRLEINDDRQQQKQEEEDLTHQRPEGDKEVMRRRHEERSRQEASRRDDEGDNEYHSINRDHQPSMQHPPPPPLPRSSGAGGGSGSGGSGSGGSKRNYENLFKKSKKSTKASANNTNNAASAPEDGNNNNNANDPNSEAYWNDQRAKLGLKPLKK